MITLNDLQDLLGITFFDGNTQVGGIVIYVMAMAIIFVLSKKNLTTALVLGIPVTLIFATLGLLSSDVMVLLILVSVLGLAYSSRAIWRD